jgi:hypothetical protein
VRVDRRSEAGIGVAEQVLRMNQTNAGAAEA